MRPAMPRNVIYLILLTLVSGLGIGSKEVWGQIVAWQFGNPASQGDEATYNATTNDANLSASVLSRGIGILPTALGRGFAANGWDNGTTKANAITNNEYFEFSINAKPGYLVSVSTLDARLRRSGSTAPNAYIWKYSINGSNFNEIGTDVSFTSTADGVDQTQIFLSGILDLQNVPSSTTITFRLYAWGGTSTAATFSIARYASGVTSNCLAIGGSVLADVTDPTVYASPATLSSFSYVLGSGPSAQHSFTVSGTNLTNNIILTPPDEYEISTLSGSSFAAVSSITLTQSGGIVNSTPIYVRLKAGLAVNTYNSKIIDVSSLGATSKSVTCNGSVTPPTLVVISQIYGGGGNTGAPYQNDYVELFNRGSSAVSLNNWSVQYAGATGNTWTVVALPNATINPGQYYLIKLASGGGIVPFFTKIYFNKYNYKYNIY